VIRHLFEAVAVCLDGSNVVSTSLLVILSKLIGDFSSNFTLFIKSISLHVSAKLKDCALDASCLNKSLSCINIFLETPVRELHIFLKVALGVQHEVLDVEDLKLNVVSLLLEDFKGLSQYPSCLLKCFELFVKLSQISA